MSLLAPSHPIFLLKNGDIMGSALAGGGGGCSGGCGLIYALVPTSSGPWEEHLVHAFGDDGLNGAYPVLAFGIGSNFFGMTGNGGAYGSGTIFELLPTFDHGWVESAIYDFNGLDGSPGTLIPATAQKFYGTSGTGFGVVFEITP